MTVSKPAVPGEDCPVMDCPRRTDKKQMLAASCLYMEIILLNPPHAENHEPEPTRQENDGPRLRGRNCTGHVQLKTRPIGFTRAIRRIQGPRTANRAGGIGYARDESIHGMSGVRSACVTRGRVEGRTPNRENLSAVIGGVHRVVSVEEQCKAFVRRQAGYCKRRARTIGAILIEVVVRQVVAAGVVPINELGAETGARVRSRAGYQVRECRTACRL